MSVDVRTGLGVALVSYADGNIIQYCVRLTFTNDTVTEIILDDSWATRGPPAGWMPY